MSSTAHTAAGGAGVGRLRADVGLHGLDVRLGQPGHELPGTPGQLHHLVLVEGPPRAELDDRPQGGHVGVGERHGVVADPGQAHRGPEPVRELQGYARGLRHLAAPPPRLADEHLGSTSQADSSPGLRSGTVAHASRSPRPAAPGRLPSCVVTRTPGSLPQGLRIALLLSPALAVVCLLFLGGVALGVAQSLGWQPYLAGPRPGLSLDAYRGLWGDPEVRASLLLTFRLSPLSTAFAATAAVGAALLLRATRRGRRLATLVFQSSLPVPHVVGAAAMALLLGAVRRAEPAQPRARPDRHPGGLPGADRRPVRLGDPRRVRLEGDPLHRRGRPRGAHRTTRVVRGRRPDAGSRRLDPLPAGHAAAAGARRAVRLGDRLRVHVRLVRGARGCSAGRFPATLPVVAYHRYSDSDLTARPAAMAIAVLLAVARRRPGAGVPPALGALPAPGRRMIAARPPRRSRAAAARAGRAVRSPAAVGVRRGLALPGAAADGLEHPAGPAARRARGRRAGGPGHVGDDRRSPSPSSPRAIGLCAGRAMGLYAFPRQAGRAVPAPRAGDRPRAGSGARASRSCSSGTASPTPSAGSSWCT